jgi:hypothetical protein
MENPKFSDFQPDQKEMDWLPKDEVKGGKPTKSLDEIANERNLERAKGYIVAKGVEKAKADSKNGHFHDVDPEGKVRAKDPKFGIPNPANYESSDETPWYKQDLGDRPN